MSRKQQVRRWTLAVALSTALAFTVQSSSQAYEWYPGLPDATFGAWSGTAQGGLSYAKRAKQWFRSPVGMTVNEAFYGQDDLDHAWIRAEGYFVSPNGAPANYGYLEPMTVRSAGFGLMPVEATVQISQRRVNGYPVPVHVLLRVNYTRTPQPGGGSQVDNNYPPITITDSFNVRILSVRVDGVDVGLKGQCRTVEPAPVTLTSPDYTRVDIGNNPEAEWYRTHDPATYFSPFYGGQLTGAMTIPPFTGCTTKAGDDLSNLMTLSASGPDNTISARVGWPCAFNKEGATSPVPPGASNPKLATEAGGRVSETVVACPGPKPFEYPERQNH